MRRSQLVRESVLGVEWSGCAFEKFRGMRETLTCHADLKTTEGTAQPTRVSTALRLSL